MAKIAFNKLNAKTNTEIVITNFNDNAIEIKQYLPFEQKISAIEDIVNQLLNNNLNYCNSAQVEYLKNLSIIEKYTNINLTDKQKENGYKLYDSIISSGLMKQILQAIPQDEIEYFDNLLNSSINNVYSYHNSIVGILDNIGNNYNNFNIDLNKIKQDLAENADELKSLSNIFSNN